LPACQRIAPFDGSRDSGEAETATIAYNLACNERQLPSATPNMPIFSCIFAFTMVVSTVVDNRPCNDQQPRNTQVILMHLSLGQAAKETGMDKSTISRAIKSGKLSATRQENRGYAIDPAELFRVFAPASKDVEQAVLARDTTLDEGSEIQALRLQWEAAALRAQLEAATLRLGDKDEEIRDLRHRLDTEGEERRKLTMRLLASHHAEPPQAHEHQQGDAAPLQPTPPPTVHSVATAPATPKKSGFWPWRRRRE
jgi:hypothetical protein